MCSACRSVRSRSSAWLAAGPAAQRRMSRPRELRVCADPNNLPFSNERGRRLREQDRRPVARSSGRPSSYTWWAQRRGFVRNTLKPAVCDLIPGMPRALDMLRTTRPYYRSTYVFVSRAGWPARHLLRRPAAARPADRRAARRRRRRQLAAGPCARRVAASSEAPRLSGLRRLRASQPAGAHRRGGRGGRDRRRGRLGAARPATSPHGKR